MLTRMLVLWLLAERPHYGYSIRKILNERGLAFWFPVEDASIYSMLRSLVKDGFARETRTEQQGRRPKRTLYAITAKGRAHYAELLREAWRQAASATDLVALAFAAHGDLPEAEIRGLADQRADALQERLSRIKAVRQAAPATEIADREAARVRAELKWLRAWIAEQ